LRAQSLIVAALLCIRAFALDGDKAQYVGGTMAVPEKADGKLTTQDASFARFTFGKGQSAAIPYNGITSLEYGQKAGRRVAAAVMVSPLALFSKKRKHYLTVGYKDEAGKDQGAVFELGKDTVRATLVAFEARSGKKIEYESEEAKKHVGN
jgi:hypothetical protein